MELGSALETYKSIENYFGGENEWHGTKGEIRVEYPRVSWPILDAWRDAADENGIPKIEEFNRGDNEGCAYFHMIKKRCTLVNVRLFLRNLFKIEKT